MTTLVLLPGMDGTGTLFADLVAALPPALRAVVVTYPPDRPLDYPELVRFVGERLPRDEPFVLLGESFSGPVAMTLAAAHPTGLAGLILCCTFARNPRPGLAPLHPLAGFLPFPLWSLPLAAPLLLGPRTEDRAMAALRRALAAVQARVWRARLRAVLAVDVSKALTDIDVPILYLQAASDRLVPTAAAQHIAAIAPSMEVVRIDGPHLLLQTRPHEATAAISDFVRRRCA